MADDAAPMPPMDLDPTAIISDGKVPVEDSGNGGAKRSREEDEHAEQKEEKRPKAKDEKSGEEKSAGDGEGKSGEEKNGGEGVAEEMNESGGATVGPKTFGSSIEMFDYFYKLLHSWTPNLNLNRYEQSVLVELLKNGHEDSGRKIGASIKAFQVRFHPRFKSRCFYLTTEDESVDDFSFRKCVGNILPLPENMQVKHEAFRGSRRRGRGRVWK